MMNRNTKMLSVGLAAASAALLLGACGVAQLPPSNQPAPGVGYGFGPGRGMGGGGMMDGGRSPGGMMDSGGMMGGGGYDRYVPPAPTTPVSPTPAVVDEEIPITISDYRFKPDQITVRPGETVRFVVTNRDGTLHNLIGQEAGIPYVELPARSTQTLTWTAPVQTGTYTAACTLHAGMSLSIVVAN